MSDQALEYALKRIGVLEAEIRRIDRLEHLQTIASWTDYSDASTIVGWSSFTAKKIHYKKIGQLVLVNANIAGPSNSVDTTFTLPYSNSVVFYSLCWTLDNTSTYQAGYMRMLVSSSTVKAFPDLINTPWTASGTKALVGQFWYEAVS